MTETILYAFASGSAASNPTAPVVLGPNGVLYGTTSEGSGGRNYGTVFELMPPALAGGTWTENILYSFTGGADGSNPNELTLGADGTLYGTTFSGGANGQGTVFALTP